MNRLEELLIEYENYKDRKNSYLTDMVRQNNLNLIARQIVEHLLKCKRADAQVITNIKDP